KFTPEGGKIHIDLSSVIDKSSQNGLQNYFEITISDTGSGIAENELEHIFECFFQAETSKSIHNGGTGIGLHLSRSIAQLHHGNIRAENNKDGQGCRFIIRLPLGNEHLSNEEIAHIPTIAQKTERVAPQPVPDAVGAEEDKVRSKSKYRIL